MECNDLKTIHNFHNIEFHQFSTTERKKNQIACSTFKQQDIIKRSTHIHALVKVLFTYNTLLWLFWSQFQCFFFIKMNVVNSLELDQIQSQLRL